jgi:hypothetical protein
MVLRTVLASVVEPVLGIAVSAAASTVNYPRRAQG